MTYEGKEKRRARYHQHKLDGRCVNCGAYEVTKQMMCLKCYDRKQEYLQRKSTRQRIRVYENNKMKNDIDFKLAKNLRNRLRKSIQEQWKKGSAVSDLGCSISEFKQYLESKFTNDMSWDNHGKWHIDHIKPLCQFDLSDESQVKEACHYTNLQPLWAEDNMSKGGK